MQKLAVVYFPKIELAKINNFREKYDPNWHIIPPHITIVSPVSDISENQLIEHIKTLIKGVKPFSVHLIGLTKTFDNYLFLLVKEGNEKIVNLQKKLYSGILSPYLPTDSPFVPHITLGSFEAEDAEDIALFTEAEKANFDITCVFDAVSIIKGDGVNPARIVKTINLYS